MSRPAGIQEIVNEYRGKGFKLSEEEIDNILWYCDRKMNVAKVADKKGYLPLLFADEVKNYLYRQAVNATTILRQLEKEGLLCVQPV